MSSKTLAAQGFQYTKQLEKTYQRAYGHDGVGQETRDTVLHGQLHEGFRYDLTRAPLVSGAN